MALGFVLITAETGRETAVLQHLSGVPEVVEILPLFGEYDLIAKVEADDFEHLGRIILSQVRTVPGVLSTKTLPTAKA